MSTTLSFGSRLVAVTVRHPAVQVAAVLWIIANAVLLLLANGVLPFDRPALADTPFVQQVALPSLGLIEVFILMAVVYALTSRREIPDIAARAPNVQPPRRPKPGDSQPQRDSLRRAGSAMSRSSIIRSLGPTYRHASISRIRIRYTDLRNEGVL